VREYSSTTSSLNGRGCSKSIRRERWIKIDRRDFLKLAGLGGIVFASGLGLNTFGADRSSGGKGNGVEEFSFVQLSDTHWGFDGPSINPDSQGTLKKAIAAVNGLNQQPDFVVFTLCV